MQDVGVSGEGVTVKFDVTVRSGINPNITWIETYSFPTKSIPKAKELSQTIINDFNTVERNRYGDEVGDRTIVGVEFHRGDREEY